MDWLFVCSCLFHPPPKNLSVSACTTVLKRNLVPRGSIIFGEAPSRCMDGAVVLTRVKPFPRITSSNSQTTRGGIRKWLYTKDHEGWRCIPVPASPKSEAQKVSVFAALHCELSYCIQQPRRPDKLLFVARYCVFRQDERTKKPFMLRENAT